jgi:[protein-PII] uridylyltransferase
MIRFTLRATGIGAVPFPNCQLGSNRPGRPAGTLTASRREPDRIASPLEPFVDLRAAVITERVGDGGIDTCTALTDGLDEALQVLGAALEPDVAIIALGGYGRGEQCIWSDVDVMVLHEGADPEALARTVFYPLWDAGLKVGHAIRTVPESHEAGGADLETLTSLLSARLVAGDGGLYDELMTVVAGLVRTRPLASRLVAEERERRRRDPYPTMTADIKEGRGALRAHQGFWWERRRGQLIGLAADAPGSDETDARATLLAIRNALHAAAGRPLDRFLHDVRDRAAAWLETDVPSLATELTAALHTGDRLADRRWPDLHVEQDPMIGFGRRIFGAIRSRFSAPNDAAAIPDTVLTLAMRAAGRKTGAWFDAAEEETIRTAPAQPWTAADRAAFVSLLSAGARGRTIFGLLEEFGWVEQEFPEWGPISTAPQLAPFHDHPVGAHLWRTTDEMQGLIEGGGEAGTIATEVGSTEELLLAAFLHDIGKARGGDHANVGADLAAGFLRSAGFGPATTGVVVDAVRHHLLLSETATRRDIANPGVIDEVAVRAGDLRRLNVLYLLTIADLRATGTTMWSPWRATLLRTLYQRVQEALEVGEAPPATPDVQAILEAAETAVDSRAVEEHVAAMPSDYLEVATPGDVLWHLEVAARLTGPAVVSVDPADPGRVLVAGADRSGFLLAVSRAFTANGVAILDARLRTRSDGIALDTFRVCDDRTGDGVDPHRWEAISRQLVDALSAGYDFGPAIRRRAETYQQPPTDPDTLEVRTRSAGLGTMVEVRGPDRIGLLTDIVEALHDEGLDIQLARIDTMGGEARDVFTIRRADGTPIRDESDLAGLRQRLADRLGS